MNSNTLLIMLAVIAWIGQIIMGWWQIKRFNQAIDLLARQGQVGIGRSQGRFSARVVLALAFDAQQHVCDAFIMRGYTVFARPRPLTELIGLHLDQLIPNVIFAKDHHCQTALSLAIKPKQ
jgi:glucitol operon activator protein